MCLVELVWWRLVKDLVAQVIKVPNKEAETSISFQVKHCQVNIGGTAFASLLLLMLTQLRASPWMPMGTCVNTSGGMIFGTCCVVFKINLIKRILLSAPKTNHPEIHLNPKLVRIAERDKPPPSKGAQHEELLSPSPTPLSRST